MSFIVVFLYMNIFPLHYFDLFTLSFTYLCSSLLLPTYAFHIDEVTGMPILFFEVQILLTFCPDWPQTQVLQISAPE
jgi:hypothetical protein